MTYRMEVDKCGCCGSILSLVEILLYFILFFFLGGVGGGEVGSCVIL